MGQIDYLERRVENMDARLSKLEDAKVVTAETAAAWRAELTSVSKEVTAIKSGHTWLLRVILGAIVLAFLTFAFQGGLAVHPPGHVG